MSVAAASSEEHQCEECDARVKKNYWSSVKAHAAGWYFRKDGRAYCPNHRPHYAPKRS